MLVIIEKTEDGRQKTEDGSQNSEAWLPVYPTKEGRQVRSQNAKITSTVFTMTYFYLSSPS
ncbi:MAG: hypothetical protein JW861_08170 [Bacteroidales bacterium]|nr:hypothetical protein [Bacteroidales bacterium]